MRDVGDAGRGAAARDVAGHGAGSGVERGALSTRQVLEEGGQQGARTMMAGQQ